MTLACRRDTSKIFRIIMDTDDHHEQQEIASQNGKNNLLSGRCILLVNTGPIGKRFTLRRMKELGLRIVVLHDEKNWADEFVDHWILSDSTKPLGCIGHIRKFLEEHPEVHLDGAITFWEEEVPRLAYICKEFGFIGNTVDIALKTRSK